MASSAGSMGSAILGNGSMINSMDEVVSYSKQDKLTEDTFTKAKSTESGPCAMTWEVFIAGNGLRIRSKAGGHTNTRTEATIAENGTTIERTVKGSWFSRQEQSIMGDLRTILDTGGLSLVMVQACSEAFGRTIKLTDQARLYTATERYLRELGLKERRPEEAPISSRTGAFSKASLSTVVLKDKGSSYFLTGTHTSGK